MERNLLDFLKGIKRHSNYIWFKDEKPEKIYMDNFELITKEFEQNFTKRFSLNSLTNRSTLDTRESLHLI